MAKDKFSYTILCIENGSIWSINDSQIMPDWINNGDIIIIDGERHMIISKGINMNDDSIILYVKD